MQDALNTSLIAPAGRGFREDELGPDLGGPGCNDYSEDKKRLNSRSGSSRPVAPILFELVFQQCFCW